MLDIGGWADPFERADWVIDVGSYDTRGLYERAGWTEGGTRAPERFTKDTWIQRDICDRKPFPFGDGEIDFVICSQTLEDVRDPVWVCSEMNRIGRAGYIETPSRLEEQSWGVTGQFVGHSHHHWLVDLSESGLAFIFKPHDIHARPEFYFPLGFVDALTREERLVRLWWKGSFNHHERILFFEGGPDEYLAGFVSRELAARNTRTSRSRTRLRRLRERLSLRVAQQR